MARRDEKLRTDERAERMAKALRANLKRRKSAARKDGAAKPPSKPKK
ncbi:MAG: hypothetical protein V3V03_05290 [Hyphomonadaceae bacterium]